jgi:hypothetical protein
MCTTTVYGKTTVNSLCKVVKAQKSPLTDNFIIYRECGKCEDPGIKSKSTILKKYGNITIDQ